MLIFVSLFIGTLLGCPFLNYEEGLVPKSQKFGKIQKVINQYDFENGFSVGFWILPEIVMSLIESSQYYFFIKENGKTIMEAYKIQKEYTNEAYISLKISDINSNQQLLDFYYPFYKFNNQWIFTLITITEELKTLRVQMTYQEEQKIENFQILELNHQYSFTLCDEKAISQTFTGRFSYPIVFDNFVFSQQNFFEFQEKCQVPDLIKKEMIEIAILPNTQIFQGFQPYITSFFEYGRKYCLFGWAKLFIPELNKSQQILIRLSSNIHKSQNIVYGDNLFRLEEYLYSDYPKISKVKVFLDAFCQKDSEYCIKDYQYGDTLQDLEFFQSYQIEFKTSSDLIYEGLQLWHFFQYEYGRGGLESFQNLFQIQFFNEAGYFSKLITEITKETIVNTNFYVFIGERDFNFDYLQATLGQIQFICNYQQDLDNLQLYCHSKCKTCNGPTQYNCLSCFEQTNRYFDEITNQCSCIQGYIETEDLCLIKNELFFPMTIQLVKLTSLNENIYNCFQGYYYGPISDTEYKCLQCPQQHPNQILCTDCWFNQNTWYLNPICKQDFITRGKYIDDGYSLITRKDEDIDLYIIDEQYNLVLIFGFQEFCQQTEKNQKCNLVDQYHLKKQVYVICKPNFYYENNQCKKRTYECLSYDNVGNCLSCKQQSSIINGRCNDCPRHCQKCEYDSDIQSLKCINCFYEYGLLNNQCQRCGAFCLICKENYSSSLDYYILQCFKCIDPSEYFISIDQVNCHRNYIEDCKYMIEFDKSDEFFATSYYSMDYDAFEDFQDDLVTTCALCKLSQAFDLTQNKCLPNLITDLDICLVTIWTKTSYFCLLSTETSLYAFTFYKECNSNVQNCVLCKAVELIFDITCLICLQGFYADRLSGQCYSCPSELNCNQCGQQQILSQDYWIHEIRSFYTGFETLEKDFRKLFQSQNQNDYEIICISCKTGFTPINGKCIPECPESCLECELIENQLQCVRCKIQNQIRPLTIFNNQCIQCPNFCSICRIRTQSEINTINIQFNDETFQQFSNQCLKSQDDSISYYDQFFGQFTQCEKDQKCQNEISLKLNLICSQDEYNRELNSQDTDLKKTKFKQENILLTDLISGSCFKYFETEYFYLLANQNSAKVLKIEILSETSQTCQFYSQSIIQQMFSKHIFTLTHVEFSFNFQVKMKFIMSNSLILYNFKKIEIKNVQFISQQFIEKSQILFSSFYYQIIILNEIFLQQNIDTDSQIFMQFQNISNLEIDSIIIDQLKIKNLQYLFFIPEQSQQMIIKVENLAIKNCYFENLIFMLFQMSSQDVIILKNFSIQGVFVNTNLFATNLQINENQYINQQQSYAGSIQLNNFNLKLNIIKCRSLIKIYTFQNSNCDNIQIIDSKIDNSSIFDLNQNATFKNMNISFSEFIRESAILENINVKYQKIFLLMAQDLRFEENTFDMLSHFIVILKQSNSVQKIQIFIQNLNLIDNFGNEFVKGSKDYEKCLIYLQANTIFIQDLFVTKSPGLTEIFVTDTDNLIIQNSFMTMGERFKFLGLHKDMNCFLNQIKLIAYVQVISLYSIKKVLLQDFFIEGIQLINFPLIAYKSDKIEILQQDEYLTIQNFTAINCLLLLTDTQSALSLIQINSQQTMTIKFNGNQFSNNIFHSYQYNNLKNSANLLLIDCQNCFMSLNESLFIKNIVTNSSDSIIQINSMSIIINECNFSQNNQFDFEILRKYLFWGFEQDQIFLEQLSDIFQIKSLTGNGYFIAQSIIIRNTNISQAKGQKGGGFQIRCQGNAAITFSQIIINDIQTLFSQQIEQGGVLNIDAQQGQSLILNIEDIKISNVYCKSQGGFLYFQSGNQQIQIFINNVTIYNIYSEQGSMIFFQFSTLATKDQDIIIQNIKIENSLEGFEKFLSYFTLFLENDLSILNNNRVIIHSEYGVNFFLNSLSFFNLVYESVLRFNQAKNIELNDIRIFDSNFRNYLISVSLYQYNLNFLQVRNLYIKNITSEKQFNSYNCYQQPQFKEIISSCQLQKVPDNIISYNTILKRKELIKECLDKLDQQNLVSPDNLGLFMVTGVTSLSNLKIINANFDLIDCSTCQNGILKIDYLQSENNNNNSTFFTQIKIKQSKCGQQSCLNFLNTLNEDSRLLLGQNQQYFELQISQLFCQNNSATFGTCLRIQNLNTILNSSSLMLNQAQQQGGAIYIEGSKIFVMIKCVIKQNQALVGGGLYFSTTQQINFSKLKNIISSNEAKYFGQNFKAYPEKLQLYIKNPLPYETKIISIEDQYQKIEEIQNKFGSIFLPSGQQLNSYQCFSESSQQYIDANLTFRIKAIQFDNDYSQDLNNTFCTIKSRLYNSSLEDELQQFTNNYTNIQVIYFNTDSSSYLFDNMIIYFDSDNPQEISLQLDFQCSCIQIPIYENTFPFELINLHQNYHLRINLKTLPCQYGEIKNQTDKSCHICDSNQGFFSLTQNSLKCDLKDDQSTLNVKPALLELKNGYWRPYFLSKDISYCYNLPNNCKGGWVQGDFSCIKGHIGALCEQCDIYNIKGDGNFAVSDKYYCNSCNNQSKNIIIVTLTTLWTFVSLFFAVQGNLKVLDELIIIPLGYTSKILLSLNKSQSGILMKILTNYLQIIAALTTFQLSLPEFFQSLINILGNPIQTSANSQDCFLYQISNISIQYMRSIWLLIIPSIYILIFLILCLIGSKFNILKFNSSLISTSLIYIFIYFQPNIIGSLMQLLSYREISGYQWVKANVTVRYDYSSHLEWILKFAIPILLFLAILIPIYLFFKLYQNKYQLEQKECRKIWGYLYHEYKISAYYWELIKIIEKEMIIIFLNFYEENHVTKGILIQLTTLGYSILNINFKPYQINTLNILDFRSTNICTLSIGLAIGLSSILQNNQIELQIPFWIILGFFNFSFLVDLISKILQEYFRNFSGAIQNIFEQIRQKIPFIKNNRSLNRILNNRTQRKLRTKELIKKLQQQILPLARSSLEYKQLLIQSSSKQSAKFDTIQQQNLLTSENYEEQDALTNLHFIQQKLRFSQPI